MTGRWGRRIGAVAVVALCAGASAYGIVPMFENRFIYYPDRTLTLRPEQLGLRHEELRLPTADGSEIHGWYLPPATADEARAYVLFSHGNAGNISGRLPIAAVLVERGMAVLMYDYRGYGESPGTPDEAGLYADGEAALGWLVARAGDPSRVVLYGRSLGGGVSWELAARHPELGGIVSDCTFTSVPDMAARLIPLPMVGSLVRTRMDNRRRVAEVTLPKLLFHGTADELIPFAMGEGLAERALPPARFVPLPGAGHNDTAFVDETLYFDTFATFVDEHVAPPPCPTREDAAAPQQGPNDPLSSDD